MRQLVFAIVVSSSLMAACAGDGERGVKTCANGIDVYEDVSCEAVDLDSNNLPPEVEAEIEILRAEAQEDPTTALANAQKIQRIMAALPSEVCRAMQSDPNGEFLQTENIAPVAAELVESTCPFR